MNTKTKTGPLFKNVEEFHLALVDYAKQALAQTIAITTAPGFDDSKRTTSEVFADEAMERLAQIAGTFWMEHESAQEDALEARRNLSLAIESFKARTSKVTVDGVPLSSLEESIYACGFSYTHSIGSAEDYVRVYRKGGKR